MSRSKTPAIAVAIVLSALIVLPVLVLMVMRGGSDQPLADPVNGSGAATTVDYDLRQLSEKAQGYLDGELAEALKQGDVSLDYMTELRKEFDKGNTALVDGKGERARKYLSAVVQSAEVQLEALALADKARALSESSYAQLQEIEYLKSSFGNTYEEAVGTYNEALRQLNGGEFAESVQGFEMTGAILGDLEARALQRVGGLLEAAEQAMAGFDLEAAKSAYEGVLKINPEHAGARAGLEKVAAIEGIAEEVQAVQALAEAGKLEEAVAALDALAQAHPNNPFVASQRKILNGKIQERDLKAALVKVDAAEAAGDWAAAVQAMEAALAIRTTPELQERMASLKAKYKAARLEALLASGYEALKTGNYEKARDDYREASQLAPDSKEARTGYEKASSLFLANIRYTQNLGTARKYMVEGRYPLASKFFNEAMAARPGNVPAVQVAEEAKIRSALEAQSEKVSVVIRSDNRTYVSIIGVLPPGKLRTEELKLYPDVYTVKGTRSGYQDVEIEFKVDALASSPTVTVECTEKR
ncbi:tetratricopeptide repeat protein [Coraliomargarita parva]|uniref:tetratricopeptide repeat protein n=1 Tax=Coraliomargarita parva TaxID=3014050 RepID=UPI0022B55F73|nr:hypothetical protein [Coraliomargarita parva]